MNATCTQETVARNHAHISGALAINVQYTKQATISYGEFSGGGFGGSEFPFISPFIFITLLIKVLEVRGDIF